MKEKMKVWRSALIEPDKWIVHCPAHGIVASTSEHDVAVSYAYLHARYFHGERKGELWH